MAALQNLQKHPQLVHALVLPDSAVPRLTSMCMHYLHGYFSVYEPSKHQQTDRLRRGLLLVAILGLALKVLF